MNKLLSFLALFLINCGPVVIYESDHEYVEENSSTSFSESTTSKTSADTISVTSICNNPKEFLCLDICCDKLQYPTYCVSNEPDLGYCCPEFMFCIK